MPGTLTRRPFRARRALPVLAAGTGLACAAALASPAAADMPPETLRFITGAGTGVRLTLDGVDWNRTFVIRQDGAVAGRPGNRHTASLELDTGRGRWGYATVEILDETCDAAGACTPVAGSRTQLEAGTPAPELGAGGAIRLDVTVPAEAVQPVDGLPVPAGGLDVDLTVTPTAWSDPRAVTPATAAHASRGQWTGGDRVAIAGDVSGTAVTVTGRAGGVAPAQIVSASWRDRADLSGDTGIRLKPVRTAAQTRPYLPPVARGAFTRETWIDHQWTGQLSGRRAIVTSTGWTVPGNTYRVSVATQLNLAAGTPLSGPLPGVYLDLDARQCAAGQAFEDCPQVPGNVFTETGGTIRLTRAGRVELTTTLTAITIDDGTGEISEHGTVPFSFTAAPAGAGLPSKDGWFYRPGSWSLTTAVRYNAVTGSARLAGRAARTAPSLHSTPGVTLQHTATGTS